MRRDCDGDRTNAAPRRQPADLTVGGYYWKVEEMDRKQIVRMALGLAGVGVAMLAMPHVAFAQEAAGAAAAAAEKGTFLTTLFISMSVVLHHDEHHEEHEHAH